MASEFLRARIHDVLRNGHHRINWRQFSLFRLVESIPKPTDIGKERAVDRESGRRTVSVFGLRLPRTVDPVFRYDENKCSIWRQYILFSLLPFHFAAAAAAAAVARGSAKTFSFSHFGITGTDFDKWAKQGTNEDAAEEEESGKKLYWIAGEH